MKIINRFTQSNRELDENGYLTVHNCLLLHNGIMEYLGEELIDGCGNDFIDGVKIEPTKIYKLNISSNELKKAKDSFKLVPIVNGHTFLGKNGENPKDYQEGSVGENLDIVKEIDDDGVEKEFLIGTLKFTNPETIELINEGKKEELSTSYSNDLIKSDNPNYDFEVINIIANHVALVNRGRAGSKVRVANKIIKNNNGNIMKKTENMSEVEDNISLEDKNDSNISDSPERSNELSEQENVNKTEQTLLGLEEENNNGSTNNNSSESLYKETNKKNNKASNQINIETLKNEMYQEIKTKLENENKNILKAYNEVKPITGDFNFFGMSESDIYKKAFENTNIKLDGNETLGELKAMYKVYNSMKQDYINNNFQTNKTSIKIPSVYI